RVNPVYIPAWIALAELENDVGHLTRSVEILEYLEHIMLGVVRWRWEKAMLAYLLGREDIFKADLAWLLQQESLSGQTRNNILNFAFSLWQDPSELVKEMGKENTVSLFLHALHSKNIDTAMFLWSRADLAELDKQRVLPYIDLLIRNQRVDEAAVIWQQYYPSDTLLYNGNFSLPLVKGGFGWRAWPRILHDEGIDLVVLNQGAEKSALHIHFNGKNNIRLSYQIKQIIPLPPGQSFTLTGEMRSKELTTDQRPFFEVIGQPSVDECSMWYGTEMVGENQDWTPFTLSFTVPDECNQGVLLRLRRRRSKKIDSLISGDLWLTNLSIQKESLGPFQ
ncbi:MAG: hypothetical protein D3909_10045, partial [Candidatus Electrothrix sp. ATG1]|nr:hypothetical protein [Candidatus Electrothrix sp. ATG1]